LIPGGEYESEKGMAKLHCSLRNFGLCVITGGSSGIGEAFVKLLLERYPEMRLFNLSRSAPEELKGTTNNLHIPCDLSNVESKKIALVQLKSLLEQHEWAKKKLLLINNSGFGTYGVFPEPGLQSQLDMVEVNAKAPLWLTGELLPYMKTNGGAILNIASLAGFQPAPFFATYGGTKAFVVSWGLALAEELRLIGIPVLTVCPGPVHTNFFRSAGFESPPVNNWHGQTPMQVVEWSLHALQKGRNLIVTGWNNRIIALFSSFVPRRLMGRVSAFVMRKLRMEQFKK
jgi:short-subunit dehydrogenase